jgi:hypothetical protein
MREEPLLEPGRVLADCNPRIATMSRPLSCVAHETVDAPKRLKNPPSGTMKLSDVATQIQYFQVAFPFQSDVRTQAARQTIEAYRR